MVELLADFPPHVAAYKASGEVHKDEYEKVVMRRVDEVAAKYDKINFLVRLETGLEEYSLAAFLNYLKVSFEHITRWNRMAIVSDQKWVRLAYDALSPLVPGEINSYELKDYKTAKQWVSAPLSENENQIK
ncbi:STAS/SEC14 domain-containing protein [Adhaeribacter swui]|uniref:STAS/SEC14 domain-containing protein n=1 Tax=Adhaeribacter swui TaxID=2086471 RepID=A0A7G7G7S4_9BACT|nr:STAS/SEC14 domain-containing protein [Adhaeribacter swui]QNF33208.1 STAS/SEC14 domain-containing protein [Adhaeribacter swui]